MLAASALWGTTGTAATFAPSVGPLAIGAVAMGVGGLLQAVTATPWIVRERRVLSGQRHMLLLGAVAVAIYPLAFYTSMRLAGVAAGTVVSIGTAPLASAVIERITDGRTFSRRWAIGSGFGLAGMTLLCVAESTGNRLNTSDSFTILGIGLGLVAGVTYAFYSWAGHGMMRRGASPRAAMGGMFGMGGLFLLPVLLSTGAPLIASWFNTAVGAYMAVVPMFAGYTLFGLGLAQISSSTATTCSLLEPAVAAVLAVVVVGEHLPILGWIGVVLVFGCLAILTAPARRAGLPMNVS